MKVISPFGPQIAKLKFSSQLINKINFEVDKINANITLAKKFSLRGIPTTILFNKQGKEFARIIGSINFKDKEFINWLEFYN